LGTAFLVAFALTFEVGFTVGFTVGFALAFTVDLVVALGLGVEVAATADVAERVIAEIRKNVINFFNLCST
jgi:hypothetical protein